MAEPFARPVRLKPLALTSRHAKRGGGYQASITSSAGAWDGTVYARDVALYARVTWFYARILDDDRDPDLDNIVKPILDALEGVVFEDDKQVCRLTVSRHDFSSGPQLGQGAADAPGHSAELQQLMLASTDDILYVEIGPTVDGPVRLGPVDGVSP